MGSELKEMAIFISTTIALAIGWLCNVVTEFFSFGFVNCLRFVMFSRISVFFIFFDFLL